MKVVLFSESILHTNLENKLIKKLFLSTLKKEKEKNVSMVKSNRGGFQTDSLDNEKLKKFLIENAGELLNSEYKFNKSIKLLLSNFWINQNYKYNYNRSHLHLGITSPTGFTINFSGVYYLEVPNDPGNIYFESNDISRCNQEILNISTNNHTDFRTEVSFTPKENDFIIFPSYLRHGVESSMSNKKRTSVAFNFVVQDAI